MTEISKIERLTSLVATLLETRVPMTAEEIRRAVDGYGAGGQTFKRMLERDKDELRSRNIPIIFKLIPGASPQESGYIINKEDYYLPDPDLTPEEQAALYLAVDMVSFENTATPLDAIYKLGGKPPAPASEALANTAPASEALTNTAPASEALTNTAPASEAPANTAPASETPATRGQSAKHAWSLDLPFPSVLLKLFGAVYSSQARSEMFPPKQIVCFDYQTSQPPSSQLQHRQSLSPQPHNRHKNTIPRKIAACRLDYTQGDWFFTGYDFERKAIRTFNLHKMGKNVTLPYRTANSKGCPTEPERKQATQTLLKVDPQALSIRNEPWEVPREENVIVRVQVDAQMAEYAKIRFGAHSQSGGVTAGVADTATGRAEGKVTGGAEGSHADFGVGSSDDGNHVFELSVGDQKALFKQMHFFLNHAEILSPESIRNNYIKHLESIHLESTHLKGIHLKGIHLKGIHLKGIHLKGTAQNTAKDFTKNFAKNFTVKHPTPKTSETSATLGKLTESERFSRLMSLLPFVIANPGASVSELSSRFDYPEAQLRQDLREKIICAGPPPRTPDKLIEVNLDALEEDDQVFLRNANSFFRPAQLSHEQALSLLAAATAVLEVGGTGLNALEAGAQKLSGVLEANTQRMMSVNVARETSPEITATLTTALQNKQQVLLEYYSIGRDIKSLRKFEPWCIFARAGHWHAEGWCHSANAPRTFNCSQVITAELLPEAFTVATDTTQKVLYHPSPDDRIVTLEIAAEAEHICDAYDVISTETTATGTMRAKIAVGGTQFLKRLLLEFEGKARLLEVTADLNINFGGVEAVTREILARYSKN